MKRVNLPKIMHATGHEALFVVALTPPLHDFLVAIPPMKLNINGIVFVGPPGSWNTSH